MVNKYIGEKCLVCDKEFSQEDDIVVCPDCGTPYHRICWEEQGSCINTQLHTEGGSWQPEPVVTEPPAEPIRCIRCGTDNPPGTRFCGQCGLPLVGNDMPRPFNESPFQTSVSGTHEPGYTEYNLHGQDNSQPTPFNIPDSSIPNRTVRLTAQSDIDGVKLGDYIEYTGRSSFSMLTSFIRFAATKGKLSFNLGAFFFPEFYLFYRKMNKKGILILAISFLLSLPSLLYYGQNGTTGMVLFKTSVNVTSEGFILLSNICSIVSMILSILCGVYANYWYYNKAKQEITEIRSHKEIDDSEAINRIRSKGGTSFAAVIGAFVAEMLMSLLFCLILSVMF